MTLKRIAELSGVSPATVSNILNNKGKFSQATRDRVYEVVARESYEINGLARDLRRKSTGIIALCLESLRGPFFSELIEGVQEGVRSANYNFIVASSYGGVDSSAYKMLNEQRVDGAIIFAPSMPDDMLLTLAKKIPLIVLDRQISHDNINTILLNNATGINQIVHYCAKHGFSKVGYISGIGFHYDNKQRLQSFKDALNYHGLSLTTEYMFEGDFTIQAGREIAEQLYQSNNFPEVMVCANDEMAIGLIASLQDLGINIPEQMSVVGFDNLTMGTLLKPRLATVSHCKFDLGVLAVTNLLDAIAGNHPDNVVVETEFVYRESLK